MYALKTKTINFAALENARQRIATRLVLVNLIMIALIMRITCFAVRRSASQSPVPALLTLIVDKIKMKYAASVGALIGLCVMSLWSK